MVKILKIAAFTVISVFLLASCNTDSDNKYVGFAECLTAKSVKLYGAYWCGHCMNQKEMFGKEAFKKINYTECDPAGPDANPKLCEEKKVKYFPAWELPDGSMSFGEMTMEKLAEKSGCELPKEN